MLTNKTSSSHSRNAYAARLQNTLPVTMFQYAGPAYVNMKAELGRNSRTVPEIQ